MMIDFQYAKDFLGMNDPKLSHTCMHLICTAGELYASYLHCW